MAGVSGHLKGDIPMLKLLVKLLSTQAAKELAVYAAAQVAKRTDNDVDDMAVRSIAKILGVSVPQV